MARRSNQSILKEISPECSFEELMLKLKLQYFGKLVQHTCILVPHRVSNDSTEDNPAGHANGNSAASGEKEKESCGKETKTMNTVKAGRAGTW